MAKVPFYRRTLFWDVPESQLDWETHRDWIVRRVLTSGDIAEACAVTRFYGRDAVLAVVGDGTIPERARAFWAKLQTLEDQNMHEETMTPGTREALRAVAPIVRNRGFMLAGGTAVALFLGHRRSEDLDFFTAAPFHAAEVNEVLQDGIADSPSRVSEDTIHTTVRGVRVSFLCQRGIKLAAEADFEGVPVATLATLLAMKLNALSSRGDRKDFIDVYAIARHFGMGGRDLLEFAGRRLPGLDRTHLLMSLSYFEDAEKTPMPEMLQSFSWRDVRRFFEEEADRVLRSEMRKDELDI